jgi:5-methylcytosine-specific restriction endonuclease McrA
MPSALARACHVLGCSQHIPCSAHGRAKKSQYPDRQLTVTEQGYGARWQRFRRWYFDEQVRQGVPNAGLCGSRLPGTRDTVDSLCAQHGYITRGRVLDHITPVVDRHDADFFNPLNLQALCDECHNRKRQRERKYQ